MVLTDGRLALLARFADSVWGAARGEDLSEDDAALVAALSWLRLADRPALCAEPDGLLHWLLTTAHAEAARLSRVRRQQLEMGRGAGPVRCPGTIEPGRDGDGADHAGGSEDVESLGDVESRAEGAVYRAYLGLSGKARLVLRLLAVEGLSYREVSSILGLPPGSIGPTRVRALTTIRRLLVSDPSGAWPMPEDPDPDLTGVLGRAVRHLDPAPDSLKRDLALWLGGPKPGRIELATLAFDSLVDQGAAPDFGDRPGTRVLAFRGARASVLVRLRPVKDRLDLVVRPVPDEGVRVHLRVPGSASIGLARVTSSAFLGDCTGTGLLSLELSFAGGDMGALDTDWVAV